MAAPEPDEAEIFNAARQIADPDARRRYLVEACGDDAKLLRRLEALLRAHGDQDTFLEPHTVAQGITAVTADGPGTHIGPYRLLEPVGEGGMGAVFRAEQLRPLQRRVAVKVIKAGMDSRAVLARFDAERQALALMDHPNIARVFDAGTTESGRPYFVMELIEGVPITRYCDERRLTFAERLRLFVPVCEAIQHAHQKGIIHRDIKPGNVLVARYDGRAVPKVIDFGVAKAVGVRLTEETLQTGLGTVIGTPEYMSPEQAEPGQADIDTRSDIYALGVLLYELLTGTTPLQPARAAGVGLLELLRRVREEEPPRPSTRAGTTEETSVVAANRGVEAKKLSRLMRGDLDWIVMRCLEKDRARRYATANGLARDIDRYLNDEPVEARPPSRGYRLRKFARKNRGLLAGAAALVLVLAAATGVSAWQAVRAREAEGVANQEREQAVAEKDRADKERERAVLERGRAEKERVRADEQAAIADAVNNFLNRELLIQASPEESPDRDLKLRTVLDRASQKIDGRFPNQPLVEAKIHTTLGAAYQSLGDLGRAEHHARRAYELYLAKLGTEDKYTVGAMINLATGLFYQRKLEDARDLYEKAIARSKTVFGPKHRITLSAMSNLAGTYGTLEQYEKARDLLEETLASQRELQGEKNRETLSTMNNLAVTYISLKQYDKALETIRKAHQVQKEYLGPTDPHTINSMLVEADALALQGRNEEALKIREAALATGEKPLTPTHPVMISARKGSAYSLWALGRQAESIKRFTEVLQTQRGSLRPHHPELLETINSLAWRLSAAAAESDRNPRRAVELAKELFELSPDSPDYWLTLGVAQYRAGDLREAAGMLGKHATRATGRDIPLNGFYLAMVYWRLGDKEKARASYDQAARWLATQSGRDPELDAFRAEAARLLGVPGPATPPGKAGK
jgi:serine/threonine protein kinase/tetratricopeptide (TPR) repeat protein